MSVDPVDEIFARFAENGDELYIGEPVTIAEHMLQTAALAQGDDAPPELVASALLHDYGHLLTDLPEDSALHGVDTQHEELGFAFLESQFPPEVQRQVLTHHADLYHPSRDGWPTLTIRDGRLDVGSVVAAPFGVGPVVRVEQFTSERKA